MEVIESDVVFQGFEDARGVGESTGLGSWDSIVGRSGDAMVAGSAEDLMGSLMGDRGLWSTRRCLLAASCIDQYDDFALAKSPLPWPWVDRAWEDRNLVREL